GTLDQVIPVSFGRQARDYLAQTPVALTYREYPAGHEITHRELQDVSAWLEVALSSHFEGREPSPTRPRP
ncbi:MAG: hypothetical protein JOZ41_03075, partial [Chloroflexi bacterium]|nr:hypothetical protein [Chloroflexota bacterium]